MGGKKQYWWSCQVVYIQHISDLVLMEWHLRLINEPVGVHNTNRVCFCFFLENLLMKLFVEANKGSDRGVRAFWFSFCHSDTSWQCNGSYEVISVLLPVCLQFDFLFLLLLFSLSLCRATHHIFVWQLACCYGKPLIKTSWRAQMIKALTSTDVKVNMTEI